nr:MAG TPA: hypothetical protein [Caudoviricetes sp.]
MVWLRYRWYYFLYGFGTCSKKVKNFLSGKKSLQLWAVASTGS